MYELTTDSNQNPISSSSSSTAVTTSPQQGRREKYRVIQKLTNNVECSLLVVCDHHIVLCQDRRLTCLSLEGERERLVLALALDTYIQLSIVCSVWQNYFLRFSCFLSLCVWRNE